MLKMKAECQDIYMIRTPGLSVDYLEKYEQQELDIYEFIQQDKELDQFFRKALLASSPSLYHSYISKPADKKKYENLKESLLKYFLRSVGRPTPFGYFATVSLGNFGANTKLKRGEYILDLRVDNNWINHVIKKLESQKDIQDGLKVKFNSLCYMSGDRVKNPYFTSHGEIEKERQIIKENSIRHTGLIDLVRNAAKSFILLSDLLEKVKEVYADVSERIIMKTLIDMLENEYLISNLRIPAYCSNSLEYVIQQLKEMKYSGEYLDKLKSIDEGLLKFQKTETEEVLLDVYKKMAEIKKAQNYIIINVGNQYLENVLDCNIKKQVENLAEVLYKIPLRFNSTSQLQKKFQEVYGTNVEVPIRNIIDKNDFNGCDLVNISSIHSAGEKEIISIFNTKVQQALINQREEIRLVAEDFAKIQSSPTFISSFDVNVLITDTNGEYRLWVGPNFGSNRAGSMIQRFSQCLDKNKLMDYNKLYQKEEVLCSEYVTVEIREFRNHGRHSNVLNMNRNWNYYIVMGCCSEEDDREITLDDIYVGMDNNKMYLYSKKLKKRLRFVMDNMLNPTLISEISRLLLGISQDYENYPLSRLSILPSELHYKYLPRIMLEGIVILPKMWLVEGADIVQGSYEEFKAQLFEFRKTYKMDTIVYYATADNRIIVKLDKEEYIHLLYNEFKRTKRLQFSEIEKGLLDRTIVKDKEGRGYVNECVFSVLNLEQNEDIYERLNDCSLLCEEERRKILCEDGWIYFKLYGINNRENEILSVKLPELFSDINCAEHFFLRYIDENGKHLRIRIKFENEENAYYYLPKINKWIQKLIDNQLISAVVFDTYLRETNRYGGKELIEACEKIFFKDSVTVEKTLKHYDLNSKEDLEKAYIIGITFVLKNLTHDLEEMFDILNVIRRQDQYRKEYREGQKQYYSYVQAVLEEKEEVYMDIKEEYIKEKMVLKTFAEQLYIQIYKKKNTNSKENIILSLVHMHCNRLTGDKMFEEKYTEIVRNTLYHIIQQQKYRDKRQKLNTNKV